VCVETEILKTEHQVLATSQFSPLGDQSPTASQNNLQETRYRRDDKQICVTTSSIVFNERKESREL